MSPSRPVCCLSAREHEVLALVAEGLTTPRIAARTSLSRHTVDSYVASARLKLGARSRGHAAVLLDLAVPRGRRDDSSVCLDQVHLELLSRFAHGESVPEAARSIHLSTRTAYRRLGEIQRAFMTESRIEAVQHARRLGLLPIAVGPVLEAS